MSVDSVGTTFCGPFGIASLADDLFTIEWSVSPSRMRHVEFTIQTSCLFTEQAPPMAAAAA